MPANGEGRVSTQLALEFPTRPRARVEQQVLPVRGTIAERYAHWRATEFGAEAFAELERRALRLAQASDDRIEINRLVAELRQTRHRQINNSYRALLARELRDRHPRLKPLIEIRQRRAT